MTFPKATSHDLFASAGCIQRLFGCGRILRFFKLISCAPNEPPSSHIDILTPLETGKCYLENCSVWFPPFNCSRQFLKLNLEKEACRHCRGKGILLGRAAGCRMELGGRRQMLGMGRWKRRSRKGEACGCLHVERRALFLKGKNLLSWFFFFYFFLCLVSSN